MASKKRTTVTGAGLEAGARGESAERKKLNTLSSDRPDRFRWEESETDEAHAAFTAWADHVRDRPAAVDRRKRNLLYASLYSNLPLLGFGVNSYTRNIPHQGRISLNALQNAIDSLVSKICKNRPRPMFTTVEGDYELREKAENADKYIDGKFYEQAYYTTIYPGKVLDTCIYGLGVTKVHEVEGDGVVERVYPWEMILDDRELLYGKPSRIGQRKFYDRQTVFDMWRREGKGKVDTEWNRDLEECVDSQDGGSDRDEFDRDEGSEQIVIYEGYRLPTPKRPGKKIVCLRGKTLLFEDYTDKESPFNFMRPEVQAMGLYGIGICERVAGIQGEINRIVRDIQQAMHLIAKPHWMVETSSNVTAAMLNNDIATIIKYTGPNPPQVYTPQSMSGEVFSHLQYLVKTLYEITGISQLSAQSQKPAGLSSAVALRTYLNVETERFNNFQRSAEDSGAQDAFKLARVIGSLPKPKATLARTGFRGRGIEQVKWGKLDFDTISVQIYPTSKMPDTPAGRREYALELAQYTQVTTDDIFEMLEWDDTEAFAKRRLAGKRNVERDIAKMRRGERVVRDAVGDHMMAFKMMLDAYEEAKHDELPEDRLAYMREYFKACYRFLTGKAWQAKGPNPLPGEAPPINPTGMVPPGAPPMGPPPMAGPPGLPPGPPMPPGAPPA